MESVPNSENRHRLLKLDRQKKQRLKAAMIAAGQRTTPRSLIAGGAQAAAARQLRW